MEKDFNLHSFDEKTGMLMDPEEMREVMIEYLEYIQVALTHPAMSLFVPQPLRFDIAAMTIEVLSLLRQTSQAEFVRRMYSVVGGNPIQMEQKIRAAGLSETLPWTHPDAPRPQVNDLDPSDPFVRGSDILSSLAEMDQQEKDQQTPEVFNPAKQAEDQASTPPPPLPRGIEDFLRNMGQEQKEEGGD